MKTWEKLLDEEWQDYVRYGHQNRWSHQGHKMARWFGKIISTYKGRKLDIGCGVIVRPVYMHNDSEWYGIDPLGEGIKRDFHFTLGKAEQLPYKDGYFDMIVFATSLDHLENPSVVISEANRVLKYGGHIAFWGGLWDDAKYKAWKKRGGAADNHHLWAFSKESILTVFKDFKVVEWKVNGASHVIIFKK